MLSLRGNLKIDAPNRRSAAHGSRPQPSSSENGHLGQQHCALALQRILPDPHNQRESLRHMEELSASIRAVGLIEPLIVTPDAEHDGLFRILSGHRRYEAALALGLEVVEAVIRPPMNEALRRRRQLIANIQREELGAMESGEALQSMLQDGSASSQQQLGEMLGKDKTWVSRAMRVLDLPADLRNKVATSQLSVSGDALAQIARVADESAQRQLIDLLLGGASVQQIRSRIRALQRKPARARARQVYHTRDNCRVIVESKGKIGAIQKEMGRERVIEALKDALEQAQCVTLTAAQPDSGCVSGGAATAETDKGPPQPIKARKKISTFPAQDSKTHGVHS